jgi:hypothetical protein
MIAFVAWCAHCSICDQGSNQVTSMPIADRTLRLQMQVIVLLKILNLSEAASHPTDIQNHSSGVLEPAYESK